MKTTSAAVKPVSKVAYEKALERYNSNAAAAKKVVDASEARIKKEMDARAEKLGTMPKELEDDAATIQRYCEENFETLFAEQKSIEVGGLTLSFRTGKHALVLNEGVKDAALIAAFQKRDMTMYLSTKVTLDKNKIIGDRDDKKLVKVLDTVGASVEQGETFSIA